MLKVYIFLLQFIAGCGLEHVLGFMKRFRTNIANISPNSGENGKLSFFMFFSITSITNLSLALYLLVV